MNHATKKEIVKTMSYANQRRQLLSQANITGWYTIFAKDVRNHSQNNLNQYQLQLVKLGQTLQKIHNVAYTVKENS